MNFSSQGNGYKGYIWGEHAQLSFEILGTSQDFLGMFWQLPELRIFCSSGQDHFFSRDLCLALVW